MIDSISSFVGLIGALNHKAYVATASFIGIYYVFYQWYICGLLNKACSLYLLLLISIVTVFVTVIFSMFSVPKYFFDENHYTSFLSSQAIAYITFTFIFCLFDISETIMKVACNIFGSAYIDSAYVCNGTLILFYILSIAFVSYNVKINSFQMLSYTINTIRQIQQKIYKNNDYLIHKLVAEAGNTMHRLALTKKDRHTPPELNQLYAKIIVTIGELVEQYESNNQNMRSIQYHLDILQVQLTKLKEQYKSNNKNTRFMQYILKRQKKH